MRFFPTPDAVLHLDDLRSSDGTQLISNTLKGHWTLVFFDFTSCTDICQNTLADTPALQRFATALGLPFRKVPGKSDAENPLDDTMDHPTAIVVLDPQGRHVGMIHPPFNAEEIATNLQKLTKETTL
ncbi:SCO family protein [Xylella fastidiosa subsp. pauca]|uniref:Thioredoxin domain-containing protein n=1 Tax=Xylella fastidiosa (strain 9a5c) TaxID=160492 RepID=Q9PDL3_XYLFA